MHKIKVILAGYGKELIFTSHHSIDWHLNNELNRYYFREGVVKVSAVVALIDLNQGENK